MNNNEEISKQITVLINKLNSTEIPNSIKQSLLKDVVDLANKLVEAKVITQVVL